jgi:iron complex outermembrane receptor protein
MKLRNYLLGALLLTLAVHGFSQNREIKFSGNVKDSNTGEIIVGAIVQIQESKAGTVTDAEGKFALSSTTSFPFTVVVSYTGYEKQEYIIEAVENEFNFEIKPKSNLLNQVVVTARRRSESAQEIPIPISVVSGAQVAETGSFNVNRLKELIPSVQLYSSNPRNTGLSIRGLGTTFGLTNDGIDPGVGFYVDGVYYARTAATTLDFIDVDQVEVLRGPQGTLFGKNTTAGAFNITSKKPSFTPGGNFELSYGNYGFIQAKTSITGPIAKKLAARLSFSGTQRDGLLYNVRTQERVNDLNNLGFRGQLLYTPTDKINVTLIADATRQRPNGYAQVYAGSTETKRSKYRQFDAIIKDLGYSVPSTNPFDRLIDTNTPWRSYQDLGGVSLNADFKVGGGTLTSTSAWRFWNWDPSNDRDFTGLEALKISQAPSKHEQWSEEIRWAGTLSSRLTGVFGVFAFGQSLKSNPYQTEEAGKDQWRFSADVDPATIAAGTGWKTPGLLDGYGIKTTSHMQTFSGAVFGQVDWEITNRLHVLPGVRVNYDRKSGFFNRETYGGLQTNDANLLALKKKVYSNQSYEADIDNTNYSGQFTVAYKINKKLNAFATYSLGFKPVGLNLAGIPSASDGKPMLELAVVKPERVNHIEAGVKIAPSKNSSLNITLYNSDIKDYQTQVQTAELNVNRGYLANAEHVRVRGVEVDGDIKVAKFLSIYGSVAYTDGKYIKFTNAPLPLEETGLRNSANQQVAFKDISGGDLPGISKWAGSLGAELSTDGKFLGNAGKFFIAADSYYRSAFSSNPTPSAVLVVDQYALLNARIGFRASEGISFTAWGRNILNKNYFEQLLPGAGNTGQYAAVLGDPRTYGVTIRYAF